MAELCVDADVDMLYQVQDFLSEQLEQNDCPPRVNLSLSVLAEEVFVNIASYAYASGKGKAIIRFEMNDQHQAIISFIDRGIAYDPLQRTDPDITLPAEERQVGGLGVFMVKKIADEVTYRREDGQNILTIIKQL